MNGEDHKLSPEFGALLVVLKGMAVELERLGGVKREHRAEALRAAAEGSPGQMASILRFIADDLTRSIGDQDDDEAEPDG